MTKNRLSSQAISDLVLGERKGEADYDELQVQFARDIKKLEHQHAYAIEDLVGFRKGKSAARKLLIDDGHEDWFPNEADDFRGIYVWYHDGKPFYAGISRGVLGRLKQHVNGKSHFSASMAYKIARTLYNEYDGGREDFDPDCEKIGHVQNWLLQQEIAMLPISDPDQLALFEIYCSIKMGTVLNTFETH
ncbi:hypothetical protein GGR28_001797 [Lewinella aquimaris]|uniref:GIY-YIG domain-containing protein n=1 Tax=Neolewinella aquimaris TaxID=1835722 RepID=A0A840E7F5_9BACT|nr:GIY-YIG nuclease family protein [Neolewinella aquimaris]MBB4079177.1 hypothetical protein [Neolewinella aquimaris]